MSHNHHYFPKTLISYTGLRGEYGNLDIIAESAHIARFQLTDQSVDINRTDAQEMIRVLAAWLAAPVSRVVVDSDGQDTVVVVDGDRRGREVVVVDGDRRGRDVVVVDGDRRGTEVVIVEDERSERSHVQDRANRPT